MKAYYLSTCSTCKNFISQLSLPEGFTFQDIKTNKISVAQLEEMRSIAGTYESLFSRRAMKYRSLGLDKKQLKESDYKQLILDEYTFLKRPVFLINGQIVIGSGKKNIERVKMLLKNLAS